MFSSSEEDIVTVFPMLKRFPALVVIFDFRSA